QRSSIVIRFLFDKIFGGKMTMYFRILMLIALFTLRPCEGSLDLFRELQCNGTYESSTFATVYKICRGCNLSYIRGDAILDMCLSNCFNSEIFKLCYYYYQRQQTRIDNIRAMVHTLNTRKA
ncbi:hypothetical protein NPIL_209501, partial [Nephila pilipes]